MGSDQKNCSLLFWLDLEMSGLDVEKEVIIEAAAIITDWNLQPLAEYQSVVKQPQKYIDNMDDWNKMTHGRSGLIDKIPNGKDPKTVEEELIALIEQYYPHDEPAVLAGNTIGQDRLFINKYFKKFAANLHYRMLDVTSWKIVFKDHYGKEFEKQNTHQALDDIRESIAEFKFYQQFISV